MECPPGKEHIEGYVKADGTRVRSYCRDKHEHLTAHDREVDRRNIARARRDKAREDRW